MMQALAHDEGDGDGVVNKEILSAVGQQWYVTPATGLSSKVFIMQLMREFCKRIGQIVRVSSEPLNGMLAACVVLL